MSFKSHITAACFALALTPPLWASETPATYATPQDALEGLVTALSAGDGAALDVFGTDATDLVSTGNPLRDTENRLTLLQLYADGYRFRSDTPDRVHVLLGADGWALPIPLARTAAGWRFDVAAGREEILARRIGLNELDTIDIMYAYVAAQQQFRSIDHDGDGIMEFASGILPSAPGARDGLFWPADDTLMGELIALATLDGFSDGATDQRPEPFGGYYYRVLRGQGPDAPGGALDYEIGGHMMIGHALLAVPAEYGNSGIHSFMIGENGQLYQADLGESTLERTLGMTLYDPDDLWVAVE